MFVSCVCCVGSAASATGGVLLGVCVCVCVCVYLCVI